METAVTAFLQFVPMKNEIRGFFRPVASHILTKLQDFIFFVKSITFSFFYKKLSKVVKRDYTEIKIMKFGLIISPIMIRTYTQDLHYSVKVMEVCNLRYSLYFVYYLS